jgi:hypothetical protein
VAFAVGSEDPTRGAISSVEKYNSAVDAWQEVKGQRGEGTFTYKHHNHPLQHFKPPEPFF